MKVKSGKVPTNTKPGGRATLWKRIVSSIAATTGLLVAGAGAEATPVTVARDNYRSATAVPETWQAFARQLRGSVEQKLEANDDRARRFQNYLASRDQGNGEPIALSVRAWVLSDGQLHRVELDGIDDHSVAEGLRELLIEGNIGEPPPEMLQPLHLRLTLRAKELPLPEPK